PLIRAGAAASTATRPASRDDREAPLWQGPGCRVYAINPKFGKVKYFCDEGLTRVFCPTPRDAARVRPQRPFPLRCTIATLASSHSIEVQGRNTNMF
ncbi:hypothetical protein, partial [Bradyrhizobium sp. CCBAU 53380]|uniref:hypothetical protein n=1 Tax=Bradyrhizobium sp. CCBAU 53380 TaxID=1325117 RepID=UPI002302701C